MFKKALFLIFFTLFLTGVFSLRLIDPIYTELKGNDFVGSIIPGSTLELTFSKEFDKYSSLKLISTLPAGFETEIVNETDFTKVFISSPSNAILGEYPLTLEIIGDNESVVFQVYFLIEKDLLAVSSDNYFATSSVGEAAFFDFTFINNSYADVNFKVSPELPWFWSSDNFIEQKELVVTVPLRSSIQEKLVIYPRKQGESTFNARVYFDKSLTNKTFSLRINATPSIKGKLESVVFGLPFYSFSLMPNFLISGLFSLFF